MPEQIFNNSPQFNKTSKFPQEEDKKKEIKSQNYREMASKRIQSDEIDNSNLARFQEPQIFQPGDKFIKFLWTIFIITFFVILFSSFFEPPKWVLSSFISLFLCCTAFFIFRSKKLGQLYKIKGGTTAVILILAIFFLAKILDRGCSLPFFSTFVSVVPFTFLIGLIIPFVFALPITTALILNLTGWFFFGASLGKILQKFFEKAELPDKEIDIKGLNKSASGFCQKISALQTKEGWEINWRKNRFIKVMGVIFISVFFLMIISPFIVEGAIYLFYLIKYPLILLEAIQISVFSLRIKKVDRYDFIFLVLPLLAWLFLYKVYVNL